METKPVSSPSKISPYLSGKAWFSAILLFFICLQVPAIDPVTSTALTVDSLSQDSMAADTMKTAKKTNLISSIEENPIWKYTAMAVGIIVVVAFALFTSMKKSKPASANPNIGYRKHHHHHHHKTHPKKS
jgi:fucose permease